MLDKFLGSDWFVHISILDTYNLLSIHGNQDRDLENKIVQDRDLIVTFLVGL